MENGQISYKAVYAVFLLFLLSILDAFYTDLGIRHQFITEANPLMNMIYEKTVIGFYGIKLILPLLMLFIVLNIKVKRHLWFLINGSLILYGVILYLHLQWITKVSIG
ncbi:DUF5658 family protein [Chungangia koreensis]|uniref:DUF5658 family protein n=1 Tax=Chungangia koreensis TaxID=752657 RepID=A0ABV8X483_9LACT